MIVELISTGSELLLGQIVNTNVTYLAKELNQLGFDVCYQSTVGDNYQRMENVFRTALKRADIVITTGGLGPTLGDITKEVGAKIFHKQLKIHEPSKALMEKRFEAKKIPYTENNLRQVMAPEGADVFLNHNGIASGIALNQDGKILIHLPGPPREMKDMFQRSVVPYLAELFPIKARIESKILNTIGIGESLLETKLKSLLEKQSNPTMALLIKPNGGVLIRITAKGDSHQQCNDLIAPLERKVRSLVGEFIYSVGEESLESAVGKLLLEQKATVACGESCTGGMVAAALTSVSGSSGYLKGSIVTYCDEVKARFLKVDEQLLKNCGAVSPEVAEAMARGVKELFNSDYSIGITGIAGPTGGTAEKPVGLVYIGVATPQGITVEKNLFLGDRKKVRDASTYRALTILWQELRKSN